MEFPRGVAADRAGNIYVADTDNSTIRKITLDGIVTTFAGTAGSLGSLDGERNLARFYEPQSLAADMAGNLFVADGSSAIRKITPAGVVSTLVDTSSSGSGPGAAAAISMPQGVAVDRAGNVFVANRGNNTISRISASGVLTTIVGVVSWPSLGNFPGPLPASIVSPYGVAVDTSTGSIYIAIPDAIMLAVFTTDPLRER